MLAHFRPSRTSARRGRAALAVGVLVATVGYAGPASAAPGDPTCPAGTFFAGQGIDPESPRTWPGGETLPLPGDAYTTFTVTSSSTADPCQQGLAYRNAYGSAGNLTGAGFLWRLVSPADKLYAAWPASATVIADPSPSPTTTDPEPSPTAEPSPSSTTEPAPSPSSTTEPAPSPSSTTEPEPTAEPSTTTATSVALTEEQWGSVEAALATLVFFAAAQSVMAWRSGRG